MKWKSGGKPRLLRLCLRSMSVSWVLGILFTGCCTCTRAADEPSTATQSILFVCPHNAAKSIMAAAYFNDHAARRGLTARASSAGTHPIDNVSTAVVALLKADGLDVSGQKPRGLDPRELSTSDLVISLGCEDLVSSVSSGAKYESWDDVPPPISDLPGAQKSIRRHVQDLASRLAGRHGVEPREQDTNSTSPATSKE